MGDHSAIEWTDATWNPVTGCSAVSAGCDNCYAARNAAGRLSRNPAYRGLAVNGRFTGTIRLLPERLDQPCRWRRPRRIFVNSMSDLFHRDIPAEFIGSVWATMTKASHHTFQVLTKRPQRMAEVLEQWAADSAGSAYGGPMWRDHEFRWNESSTWPLPNVWLGTSIETDRYTFRADHLRATPAEVRFLSLEPLLGPLPSLDLTGIDGVIVGGESGPRARPMHPDWVRDIRDRCLDRGVPFFFKQWGEWTPLAPFLAAGGPCPVPVIELPTGDGSQGGEIALVGKRAAGRLLDGRTWNDLPPERTAESRHG